MNLREFSLDKEFYEEKMNWNVLFIYIYKYWSSLGFGFIIFFNIFLIWSNPFFVSQLFNSNLSCHCDEEEKLKLIILNSYGKVVLYNHAWIKSQLLTT